MSLPSDVPYSLAHAMKTTIPFTVKAFRILDRSNIQLKARLGYDVHIDKWLEYRKLDGPRIDNVSQVPWSLSKKELELRISDEMAWGTVEMTWWRLRRTLEAMLQFVLRYRQYDAGKELNKKGLTERCCAFLVTHTLFALKPVALISETTSDLIAFFSLNAVPEMTTKENAAFRSTLYVHHDILVRVFRPHMDRKANIVGDRALMAEVALEQLAVSGHELPGARIATKDDGSRRISLRPSLKSIREVAE